MPIPEEKQPNSTPNMQTIPARGRREHRNYTSRGHSFVVARSVQKVAKFLGVANNVNKRLFNYVLFPPLLRDISLRRGCLSFGTSVRFRSHTIPINVAKLLKVIHINKFFHKKSIKIYIFQKNKRFRCAKSLILMEYWSTGIPVFHQIQRT